MGELLDSYPQLEAVLLEMSPAFEKLRNPILRRTVARVATLQQVAVVGGLNIEEMINRLRKEAGQESFVSGEEDQSYISSSCPDWFDAEKITTRFDATSVINAGNSPMSEILHLAGELSQSGILELKAPFVPAPVIDILRQKNFRVFCLRENSSVICYISR